MNWEGFLMGISDFGLERLKEERQKKMQKELLELQQKYEQESARFKQKLKDDSDRKRSASTRETADGQIQHQNVFGEDIGSPFEQSEWVQQERDMARENHESNIAYRQGQLDNQSRQIDLSQQSLREARAAREAGNTPNLPDSDEAAIERIFAPLLETAKNPAEQGAIWDVATRVYNSHMMRGENPPTAAQLRGYARQLIQQETPTGQFGNLWRYDTQQ